MIITITVLSILLGLSSLGLLLTTRKLTRTNGGIKLLSEEKMELIKENIKLQQEIKDLKQIHTDILFSVGESYCQISYQVINKYIPEKELHENCENLVRIGDLLKAKKIFQGGNKNAEDKFNELLKELYGIKETICLNEINLIRIADTLFCDDFKNILLNFKPITL